MVSTQKWMTICEFFRFSKFLLTVLLLAISDKEVKDSIAKLEVDLLIASNFEMDISLPFEILD